MAAWKGRERPSMAAGRARRPAPDNALTARPGNGEGSARRHVGSEVAKATGLREERSAQHQCRGVGVGRALGYVLLDLLSDE